MSCGRCSYTHSSSTQPKFEYCAQSCCIHFEKQTREPGISKHIKVFEIDQTAVKLIREMEVSHATNNSRCESLPTNGSILTNNCRLGSKKATCVRPPCLEFIKRFTKRSKACFHHLVLPDTEKPSQRQVAAIIMHRSKTMEKPSATIYSHMRLPQTKHGGGELRLDEYQRFRIH